LELTLTTKQERVSNITIYPSLLQDFNCLKDALSSLDKSKPIAIITDSNVEKLYGRSLQENLLSLNFKTHIFHFPAGETSKTRATKESIENQMLENGLTADLYIFALGGGVVTDIAGYIAATFCRGVPLIAIPTSLTGMIDASIGGKNGISVPQGKNLIGTIYQPKMILIDLSLLNTLSKKELRNGAIEMVKHGLVADRAHFDYLETHADQILALTPSTLKKAVYDSCQIKVKIVESDEIGVGQRHLLNFGHTIGHALEKLTHYTMSHGEAVAIGILVESYLACLLNYLKPSCFERIKAIFNKYQLPLSLPYKIPIDEMLNAMALDKKTLNGERRFVILQDIGHASSFEGKFCTPVDLSLIKNALSWMNSDITFGYLR